MSQPGQVLLQNYTDSDSALIIIEGSGQQTASNAPVRIYDNNLNLIASIGPNGSFNGGSQGLSVRSITAATATINPQDGVVLANATSNNITLTLPAANAATPFSNGYRIIKTDSSANTVTIQRAGSDTIMGFTSIVLTSQFEEVTLHSNGSNQYFSAPGAFNAANNAIKKVTTSPYTATVSDYKVLVDATSGAVTFNLPAANSVPAGWEIRVEKIDSGANAVTVTRAGSDTIEGANTVALSAQYNNVRLTSDGVGVWYKF